MCELEESEMYIKALRKALRALGGTRHIHEQIRSNTRQIAV